MIGNIVTGKPENKQIPRQGSGGLSCDGKEFSSDGFKPRKQNTMHLSKKKVNEETNLKILQSLTQCINI